jgi:hypothetical protein
VLIAGFLESRHECIHDGAVDGVGGRVGTEQADLRNPGGRLGAGTARGDKKAQGEATEGRATVYEYGALQETTDRHDFRTIRLPTCAANGSALSGRR